MVKEDSIQWPSREKGLNFGSPTSCNCWVTLLRVSPFSEYAALVKKIWLHTTQEIHLAFWLHSKKIMATFRYNSCSQCLINLSPEYTTLPPHYKSKFFSCSLLVRKPILLFIHTDSIMLFSSS